jgi:hypothetical protein
MFVALVNEFPLEQTGSNGPATRSLHRLRLFPRPAPSQFLSPFSEGLQVTHRDETDTKLHDHWAKNTNTRTDQNEEDH